MLEKYQRVYATIDLDAVHDNIEEMKRNISPDTQIMGIIKADGYGHGAVMIGKELEPVPYVFGYGVATAEEAFHLLSSGETPILAIPVSTFICTFTFFPSFAAHSESCSNIS